MRLSTILLLCLILVSCAGFSGNKDHPYDDRDDDGLYSSNDRRSDNGYGRRRNSSRRQSSLVKITKINRPVGSKLNATEYFEMELAVRIPDFQESDKYYLSAGFGSRRRNYISFFTKVLKKGTETYSIKTQMKPYYFKRFHDGAPVYLRVTLMHVPSGARLGKYLVKLTRSYRRGLMEPVLPMRVKLTSDKTIQLRGRSLTFKSGTWFRRFMDGRFESGTLLHPATFRYRGKNIHVAPGPVAVFRNGRIRIAGKLAKNIILKVGRRKIRFRRGGPFLLHRTGQVYQGDLAETMAFTRGGFTYSLNAGTRVWFFADGKLYYMKLVNTMTIPIGKRNYTLPPGTEIILKNQSGKVDNLWNYGKNLIFYLGNRPLECLRGTAISFDESGRMRGCRLANAIRFTVRAGTLTGRAGSEILFNRSLTPYAVEMTDNAWFRFAGQRVLCNKKKISFHENGTIRSCSFLRPVRVMIKGNPFHIAAGHITFLYPDETVFGAHLARPFTWRGPRYTTVFRENQRIVFYADGGHITGGILAREMEATLGKSTLRFKAGGRIAYYPNGRLKSGILAEGITLDAETANGIRTIRFRPGQTVRFDKQGQAYL